VGSKVTWLAHFTDPAGNFIGLLKPPQQ